MEIMELIKERHSVRRYKEDKIEEEKRVLLDEYIKKCNEESGMNIQSFYDEPKAFKNSLLHYGKFTNANNYIALIGTSQEQAGYYGEKIVLKAQELGLNTCWVVLTYDKKQVKFNKKNKEKLLCVISVGYGMHNGKPHNSKKPEDVLVLKGEKPEWLDRAVESCLLAPTALNQQKFKIICDNGNVIIKKTLGVYTTIDLGIIKCHFDLATNKTTL